MARRIDVKVSGTCVTRNGEFPVGRMVASLDGEHADVRFVSARLRRALHSGARLRAADLDAFCTEWLAARGRPLDAGAGGARPLDAGDGGLRRRLREVAAELAALAGPPGV